MPFLIFGIVGIGFGLLAFNKASANLNQKSDSNTKFNRLDTEFKAIGSKYGVDWKLLKAISLNESSLGENPRVKAGQVSYDGLSWGIMQFTLSTAQWLDSHATIEKLKDEKYSIELAGKFFRYLKTRFSGQTQERDIVMSYNHGEGNQIKFLKAEKSGTLKETDYSQGREYWKRYQSNYKRVQKGV